MPQYCHNISEENYLSSPKMPVKDHLCVFRELKTSFRRAEQPLEQNAKEVLKGVDLNQKQVLAGISELKELHLLKPKVLQITRYQWMDRTINSCSHTRQTNPGYSRNSLGGIYTK